MTYILSFAAIYMYPIYAGIFGFAFEYANRSLRRYYSRRDTIHKHYIMLHPELFPPPRKFFIISRFYLCNCTYVTNMLYVIAKVKIGELLEDWYPTR